MQTLDQYPIDSALLRDIGTLTSYADGQSTSPADNPDEQIHFILSGHAEIERETSGNTELLGTLSSGDAYTELRANQAASHANSSRITMRAKGELQTVAIAPSSLFKLTATTSKTDQFTTFLRDMHGRRHGKQLTDEHPLIVTFFRGSEQLPIMVQYGSNTITVETQQNCDKATSKSLVFIDQEHSIERRLQVINRRIISAHLTVPCCETLQIITAICHQQSLRHIQRASFERSGLLFGRAMNSDYLCICMRLTHSQLKSEFENGHDSVDALRQQTGAATACGTCLECVQDLVDELTHESNTSDTSDASHTTNTTLAHGQADAKGQLAPDFLSLGVGIVACVITLIGLSIPLGSEAFHQWQASSAGRWWSGGAFLCFLGYQWWMPIYRWSGGLAKADSLCHTHRRIGACMPLLLLFHNTSYGAGMLSLLTVAVLLHTIIGVADSSLISGQQRQQTYLRVWLFPHILLAFLITVLSLYHVWVILTHGGP